jgi:hypothetical protein
VRQQKHQDQQGFEVSWFQPSQMTWRNSRFDWEK